MFFHAMRALGLVAASAVVALGGARQAGLQGVETGHFITNPGTQGATVITDDFGASTAPTARAISTSAKRAPDGTRRSSWFSVRLHENLRFVQPRAAVRGTFSSFREPLFVEGEIAGAAARRAHRHLVTGGACRRSSSTSRPLTRASCASQDPDRD